MWVNEMRKLTGDGLRDMRFTVLIRPPEKDILRRLGKAKTIPPEVFHMRCWRDQGSCSAVETTVLNRLGPYSQD
jgi:hypothetical protein